MKDAGLAAEHTGFITDDRGDFDDLLTRLARVDDGMIRWTRRELVAKLRDLVAVHRLVNERALFLALAPGGELLFAMRRYYSAMREIDAALDRIEETSPRSSGYEAAVDAARAAVGNLFESVQRPLAALAAERLDRAALERLSRLATTLRATGARHARPARAA
jgi:hypothetical protein